MEQQKEKQGYCCRDCSFLEDGNTDSPFCWVKELYEHLDPDSPKCNSFVINETAKLKGEK